jgi:hypothetical protein
MAICPYADPRGVPRGDRDTQVSLQNHAICWAILLIRLASNELQNSSKSIFDELPDNLFGGVIAYPC